jgi:hypothetical protein
MLFGRNILEKVLTFFKKLSSLFLKFSHYTLKTLFLKRKTGQNGVVRQYIQRF